MAGETDVLGDGFEWVGSFRYLKEPARWEWSDEVARMHGYDPGTVTPTTELILSHKHPEDKDKVSAIIGNVLAHGAAFSSRHRIVDTAGVEHEVVVVGDQLLDDAGHPIGTAGFYIDVTDSLHDDMQKSISAVVARVEERRAVINQAIGIIMMTYGVSAERAFEVLVWRSQQTNVKLRAIAQQFVDELSQHPMSAGIREYVDHVLLTAHERIDGVTEDGSDRDVHPSARGPNPG
jgi:hypothetical protein